MEHQHAAKRARTGDRTLLACTECKQRKLKCDGQSPRCQNCIKNSRECVVEDPATGLHRPRDYMQMLESHVAYLESLLQESRPDVAGDHLAGLPSTSSNPVRGFPSLSTSPEAIPGQPAELSTSAGEQHSRNSHTSPEQAREDGPMEDLSSDVALLCLNAAGREPHYFGPSSAVSFSRIASRTMGLRRGHVQDQFGMQPDNPRVSSSRPHTSDLQLPSESTAESYKRAYFTNIHPQYPFLHGPSFSEWEARIRKSDDEGALSSDSDMHLFFVLMVYAIGCLTLGPSHYDDAENLYAMAMDRIANLLELDSLESIQSLLCCAVYSIRSPVGASLWKVSGMAIRHCVELGYHRSADKFRSNVDVLTREMSRRCFWVAYDIDRVAANVLGRPDGISDHFIDAEYPLDIDDEYITAAGLLREPRTLPSNPPTQMSGAIHVIKLRRLWSRFNMQIYQSPSWQYDPQPSFYSVAVQQLRKELDDWITSVPATHEPKSTQPRSTFSSSSWFHLAYHHSKLLLYRPFIMETASSGSLGSNHLASPAMQEAAFRECFTSAGNVCTLYRALFKNPTIQLTWGGLHILFLAALTYLYCLWRSEAVRSTAKRGDVITTCMSCTTVLVITAERWPSAAPYRNLFESLSERTISMVCGETPTAQSQEQIGSAAAGATEAPLQKMMQAQDWILQDLEVSETQGLVQELMHGICQPSDTFGGGETLNYDFNWQG